MTTYVPTLATVAPRRTSAPSRWDVLAAGLAAAAELTEDWRRLVAWQARAMALYVVLRGAEEVRARTERQELALRLGEAAVDAARWQRIAERLADRAVVAEARLDAARAALPALRVAAGGTSRAAVLAAIDAVERATR